MKHPIIYVWSVSKHYPASMLCVRVTKYNIQGLFQFYQK